MKKEGWVGITKQNRQALTWHLQIAYFEHPTPAPHSFQSLPGIITVTGRAVPPLLGGGGGLGRGAHEGKHVVDANAAQCGA